MASATTIKEIAEMAGVSKTTVSLVLNGKGDRISEVTAAKVRRIAEESGYITNALARGLFMRQSETLGLIIPDITNPFFTGIARGAEDRARLSGYSVIYGSADDMIEREDRLIKTLVQKRVDGLIISHAAEREGGSPLLDRSSVPVVLIDRDYEAKGMVSRVLSDNVGGAKAAVQHMISRGKKKIICFAGPLNTKTSRDRRDGYLASLREAGLTFTEDMLYQGDYSVGAGQLMAEALIDSGKKFDAVFCANDLIAIGALRKFLEKGYKIPEDLAITGFDDSDIASLISPALTTVRQPTYEMGFTAVDCMIQARELEKMKTLKAANPDDETDELHQDSGLYKGSGKSSMSTENSEPAFDFNKHFRMRYAAYAPIAGYVPNNAAYYGALPDMNAAEADSGKMDKKLRGAKSGKDKAADSFAAALPNQPFFTSPQNIPGSIGKAYSAKPGIDGKPTRSFDYNPFLPHVPFATNEPFPAYVVLKTELIVRETT